MKIKTKLLLIAGFSTLAIIVLSIFLYFSLYSYNLAIEKNNIAAQVTRNIFENNQLLNEYLLYYEDRPRDLWVEKNDSVVALIKSQFAKFSKDSEKEIINNLLEAIGKDQKAFLELIASREEVGKNDVEQQARLSAQILINNQEAVSSVSQLAVISSQDATFAQNTVVNFLVGLIALILLIVVTILYFIWLSIVKPLIALKEATARVAALDFTTTTTTTTTTTPSNDEMGQLARAFNIMVVKLKESYASLKSANIATQNVLEDLSIEKSEMGIAKAKDEALLQSIGDGVIATDRNGMVVVVNKAAENILGFTSTEMMGKLFIHAVTQEGAQGNKIPDKLRPITLALGSGKTTTASTYQFVRKDGSKVPVAMTVTPVIIDSKTIGAILVFRDNTKEKDIDKAKTEFVSLASHQLRTPLSTVNWYSEMLLSGDVGKVTAKQRKYLDEVYRGNQRMIDLVNALLNVSRLDLGTFVFEPVPTDVVKLAQRVIDELRLQLDQKKLKFDERHGEGLSLLNVDPKLLTMVFQNILSNAIAYTPEKGIISLDLRLVKQGESIDTHKANEDSIAIVVRDTGYGIPKAQQDKIFTKLFRADNVRDKDTEGTGLGLYIVKSVIDHSGGMIWFESEENKGTTFYVTLPLAGMEKSAKGGSASGGKESTKALS